MHRCFPTALLGLFTGCAAVAYGQEVPMTPSDMEWVELIRALGLPGVLAYIGYVLGKGFPTLHVQVQVDPELRKAILDIADKARED